MILPKVHSFTRCIYCLPARRSIGWEKSICTRTNQSHADDIHNGRELGSDLGALESLLGHSGAGRSQEKNIRGAGKGGDGGDGEGMALLMWVQVNRVSERWAVYERSPECRPTET